MALECKNQSTIAYGRFVELLENGHARVKRTKTNHEMPLHRVISREEAEFTRDAARNAPQIPAGIHEVARVGHFPDGLIFCQTTDYRFFRLPHDLAPWASTTIGLGIMRLLTFPCKIEFGYGRPNDGRAYANFL